ncbi:hypothetical protein [Flavobacterium selenitireducens]|uniref:hypothetical protein n=1 Tax=Flavobacterium selenitireducens TaxID=2722704 RepID=UPI00168C006D|nr:hypothetical protein [Flavobacterium selenitireducens]MBD3581027.1 hypothetical protein [Flavobacterium selenitireducens]
MLAIIHDRCRPLLFFKIFTWGTRLLLFLAFLPSGYKKLAGLRFTSLGIESPIGFFFEALFRSGYYWNFLGLMQLTAGVLLLVPRTATFGALLYLPIIVNILVIVCSMHFSGTPVIVGLMLMAVLYLLLWDWPKLNRIGTILFEKDRNP